jgi:hypothetical protein
MSDEEHIIDLTSPKKARIDVISLDDDHDEVQFVGFSGPLPELRPFVPPPRVVYHPANHVPKRICSFGVRCNRMTDPEHLAAFSHADHEIRPLPTLALPVNMFGGPAAQHAYLLQRQRELERQERELVAAVADSLRAEAESKERQRVRDLQDLEYQQSLAKDKKVEASKRQQSSETICVEDAAKVFPPPAHVLVASPVVVDAVLSLDPEPDASEAGAVAVTVQLFDGTRHTRRFRCEELCENVYTFARTKLENAKEKIDLVQLPEGRVDPHHTVASVGKKRVLLFVKTAN